MQLKIKTVFFLLVVFGLFCNLKLSAQSRIRLRSQVRDTTNIGIPGANVLLIAGKDSLSTTTDSVGIFSFKNLKAGTVSLLVRSIGYQSRNKNYLLKDEETEQQIPAIVLQAESQQLKEVVIKAKIIPMRLMKDTLEFNAAAYTVREDDKVDDLLKQLPGITVDKDGNVTSAGKEMTKLRVNGKDFFTNNVKDFIAQLPAGIVDKIQVIEDYGDKANFTGIKNGEPQKMLNLVLKPNRNQGKFGNITASGGTNDRYALNLNGNLWQDTKQIGINSNASNTNTGAGINTNANLGVSYRNKLGKKMTLSGNYNYRYNRNESMQESYTETVNSLGTLFNQSNSENSSNGNNHIFDLNLESTDQENYVKANLRGSVNQSLNNRFSAARQSGVIRQDLNTQSLSELSSPNVNAEINFGRKFKKPGRIISGGLTTGTSSSANNDNQDNRIVYYDQDTGLPVKDSIRNQLVDTRDRQFDLKTNFTYSEPLGNTADSLVKRAIDLTYDFSLSHTRNDLGTFLNDEIGIARKVDTLSNQYTSSFSKHTISVNYRYDAKKINYNVGLTAQPNLLTGAYEGRGDQIHRAGFNLSPVARLTFMPSRKNTLSLYYNGNSVIPNFNQLQPVPDTRNLQNVIIGNPDLKAAFNHALNLSYRIVNDRTGGNLQFSIRGNIVQDQVVSNTVLIRDTLNSLKQETRYLNTNGNYNLGGNYFWSLPFEKKYYLDVRGSLGYDHRITFADQTENLSKGVNLIQTVAMRMNQKWLMVNTNVNYNYRSNVYSLASSRSNTVQTWVFNVDARTYILKTFTAGLNSTKTINQGFNFAGASPLLLNGFVEKFFFKGKAASIKLEGNDLLKQGNNLSRTVSDNSITENKSNQITRYFLLSLSWRLQQFGGKG